MNTANSLAKNTQSRQKKSKKNEFTEILTVIQRMPSIIVTLFIVSVIVMNLLANKTIIQNEWIAIDGGILISWLTFMCMDIITKLYGPKAANSLTITAMFINLFVCMIFYLASIIPSNADDYTVFNQIFGGTWFILLSSSIAFVSSSLVNNYLNHWIGIKLNDDDSRHVFAIRSFGSTFVGQFIDNFIFAFLVFMIFAPIYWDGFHWTLIQCLSCALTGAFFELLMEVLFSPIGYQLTIRWKYKINSHGG